MAKKRVSEEMQSLDLQKPCKKLLTKGRVDRLEAQRTAQRIKRQDSVRDAEALLGRGYSDSSILDTI